MRSFDIGEYTYITIRKAYIGKESHLPSGSIVGTYAVVTKPFVENNTMIAGNPAVIKKRNIYWEN